MGRRKLDCTHSACHGSSASVSASPTRGCSSAARAAGLGTAMAPADGRRSRNSDDARTCRRLFEGRAFPKTCSTQSFSAKCASFVSCVQRQLPFTRARKALCDLFAFVSFILQTRASSGVQNKSLSRYVEHVPRSSALRIYSVS